MILTISDGQCFIPPMIIHQAENYTQDIHWNLPSNWLVHNMPSGYMDRGGWMEEMSIFSRTCGTININPQFLFFEGHDIHFYDRAKHLLWYHHISQFILKAGDSTNDQPNDNGPNLKLKRYYIIAKVKWKRQHRTLKLLLPTLIMFLWRCGIIFNKNNPLSPLTPLTKRSYRPLPHLITTPMPNHV